MAPSQARLSRAVILEAAYALAVEGGLRALSIRSLAKRLDVTAPALYLYFPNKRSIIAALADQEFERLAIAIEVATTDVTDSIEQVKAQCRAYVECVCLNPLLASIIFTDQPPWTRDADGPTESIASRSWQVASVPVRRAIAEGRIREPDPLIASLTIWSAVHGLAMLLATGSGLGPDQDRRLLESVLDVVMNGLALGSDELAPG